MSARASEEARPARWVVLAALVEAGIIAFVVWRLLTNPENPS